MNLELRHHQLFCIIVIFFFVSYFYNLGAKLSIFCQTCKKIEKKITKSSKNPSPYDPKLPSLA